MQRFCEIYEINEINDCYSYGTLILSCGFCCVAAAAKALEINVLVFASAIEPTAGAKRCQHWQTQGQSRAVNDVREDYAFTIKISETRPSGPLRLNTAANDLILGPM